jgi:trk system potassium uptake protein TrkA
MKIVIVGCGRVGSTLARRLVETGHTVSVVDKDRSAFERLGEEFQGRTVQGLGFDEEVLKKAGIGSADAVLAFTGGDNSNIMSAQIAREKYGISKVYARVKDPLRAEVYRDMGLSVYCSTLFSVNFLEDALQGRPFRAVEEYLALAMLGPLPDGSADPGPTPNGEKAADPTPSESAPA